MLEPGKNQIENTLVAAAEWELGKLKFEDPDFFRLEGSLRHQNASGR